MARSFAGATTDRVNLSVASYDAAFSAGCWFYQNAQPTSTQRILHTATGATGILDIVCLASTDNFIAQWTGSTAVSRTTTGNPLSPYGTWRCIVYQGDRSTTSANYTVNMGTLSTPMAVTTTTGINGVTLNGAATTVYVGNRTGNDRALNGRVCQAFLVPWQMTLDEMERFRLGDWTVLYAHGAPRWFLPLTGAGLRNLSEIDTGLATVTGTTVVEDPPIAAGWGNIQSVIVGPGGGAPALSGVARPTAAVIATQAGSRQASGAVSARVAVVATAAATRQATGRANSPAAVVAKTTGAQLTAVGGVVRAAVAVAVTAVEKRQTTGAANSPSAVTATAVEKRQTSGAANSPAAVVVKTAGTQGAVIGGAVRAAVAVFARTAGSRQATGTANSPATVVARTAASRATSGASTAGVVAVARTAGGQVAVIGGTVNAAMSGTARAAGKHGGTGIISAAATGTARCTGKHGGTGTVRAVGVAYCLVAARRATSGASRAVGVVVATPRATVSALGGDAQQALSSPGATSSLSRQGATVTFQRVNRATQELQPL